CVAGRGRAGFVFFVPEAKVVAELLAGNTQKALVRIVDRLLVPARDALAMQIRDGFNGNHLMLSCPRFPYRTLAKKVMLKHNLREENDLPKASSKARWRNPGRSAPWSYVAVASVCVMAIVGMAVWNSDTTEAWQKPAGSRVKPGEIPF